MSNGERTFKEIKWLSDAAEDLLEATEELLATHPAAYRKPGPIDNRTDNAIKIARAAIAKAKGKGS